VLEINTHSEVSLNSVVTCNPHVTTIQTTTCNTNRHKSYIRHIEWHTCSVIQMSMYTKKLSYRRGTAQCTELVSSCYVSRGTGVRKVLISKSDPQGHWQQCHL